MEKRIEISKDRVLRYRLINNFPIIEELFFENGELEKNYTLNRTQDYCFDAMTFADDDVNELSFEYDENHPLYLPLLHLLNNEEKLIIDDDYTREEYQKYLIICKDDNKIILSFINNSNRISISIDKFNIVIINIIRDLRSKIDQKNMDTKEKLTEFFREVNEIFSKEEKNKVYYK